MNFLVTRSSVLQIIGKFVEFPTSKDDIDDGKSASFNKSDVKLGDFANTVRTCLDKAWDSNANQEQVNADHSHERVIVNEVAVLFRLLPVSSVEAVVVQTRIKQFTQFPCENSTAN